MPGPSTPVSKSTNVRVTMPWPVHLGLRLGGLVAPAWVAERLLARFLRTRRPGRPAAWTEGLEPELLPLSDGRAAAAWSTGRGPVVHLLHGWDGSAADWRTLAPALAAAGHRAVALEAPGHGRGSGGDAHLRWFAETLAASVARFGPGPVVAHSFGAAAAGMAAADGLVASPLLFLAPEPDPAEWLLAAAAPGGDRLQRAVLAGMSRRLQRAADRIGLQHTRPDAVVVHDTDDRQVRHGRVAKVFPAHLRTSGLGHRGVLHHRAVVQGVVDWAGRGVVPAACPHGSLLCETCALDRALFDRAARAA